MPYAQFVMMGRERNLLRGWAALALTTAVFATAGCEPGTFDTTTMGNTPPGQMAPKPATPPTPPGVLPPPPPGVAPLPPPPTGAVPPPAPAPAPAPAPTPMPAPMPAPAMPPGSGIPLPPLPPGVVAPPLPPEPPATPPPGTEPPKVISLVVGDGNAESEGDVAIAQVFEAKGYLVLSVDDSDDPDTGDLAFVVISPSTVAGTVAAKYRALPTPVIVMNSAVFDDMRMTGTMANTAFGTVNGRAIVMAQGQTAHPLSAGLSGTVNVAGGNAPLNWGVPAATATIIATLPNAAQRATIFGYESGAMMQGQVAPAKRLGFFASEDLAANEMSADAELLLQAAGDWAFKR
jgi:hypothetical protein